MVARTNIKKWTVFAIQLRWMPLAGFFKQRKFLRRFSKVVVRIATVRPIPSATANSPISACSIWSRFMLLDKTSPSLPCMTGAYERSSRPPPTRQSKMCSRIHALTARRPRREAIVELTFTDGTQLSDWVRDVAHADNPMTRDEVVDKARDLINAGPRPCTCSNFID